LDVLLRKATEGVSYRRILCFGPDQADGPLPANFVRPHIKEHCLKMLDIATQHPGNVVVKRAPAILMADIFIINHQLGAISMETYAESAQLYTAGALIVHDPPNGRIIEQLRAWWDETYANSTVLRKSEITELPPPVVTSTAG
jgi:hypothetical protein